MVETVGAVAKDLIARSDFLTAVGVVLACVAIMLALGGVFAFVSFRRIARKEARKIAKVVAEEVAEQAANAYLQHEMPALLRAHDELAANIADVTHEDAIATGEGRGP